MLLYASAALCYIATMPERPEGTREQLHGQERCSTCGLAQWWHTLRLQSVIVDRWHDNGQPDTGWETRECKCGASVRVPVYAHTHSVGVIHWETNQEREDRLEEEYYEDTHQQCAWCESVGRMRNGRCGACGRAVPG